MSPVFRATAGTPLSRRRAPTPAASRLSRLYRHLFLWVLQTWLAMFYIGAGYAKLSQPKDLLALMMTWPARVGVDQLQAIGWIEIGFAASVVSPLLSWPVFRPLMLVGAFGLLIDAGFMASFHALERDGVLALVNGLLMLIALAVIVGRWPGGAVDEQVRPHAR